MRNCGTTLRGVSIIRATRSVAPRWHDAPRRAFTLLRRGASHPAMLNSAWRTHVFAAGDGPRT